MTFRTRIRGARIVETNEIARAVIGLITAHACRIIVRGHTATREFEDARRSTRVTLTHALVTDIIASTIRGMTTGVILLVDTIIALTYLARGTLRITHAFDIRNAAVTLANLYLRTAAVIVVALTLIRLAKALNANLLTDDAVAIFCTCIFELALVISITDLVGPAIRIASTLIDALSALAELIVIAIAITTANLRLDTFPALAGQIAFTVTVTRADILISHTALTLTNLPSTTVRIPIALMLIRLASIKHADFTTRTLAILRASIIGNAKSVLTRLAISAARAA